MKRTNVEMSDLMGAAYDKLSEAMAIELNIDRSEVDNYMLGHVAIPLITNFGADSVRATIKAVVDICDKCAKDEAEV